MVARNVRNVEVRGSNPLCSTKHNKRIADGYPFVFLVKSRGDLKGTARQGKKASGGWLFSSPGWRQDCPSLAGNPLCSTKHNKRIADGYPFVFLVKSRGDLKGTARQGKKASGGWLFSSPGWRQDCPSLAGNPLCSTKHNKRIADGYPFVFLVKSRGDLKGTARQGKKASGGWLFSSPGWRQDCPSLAGNPLCSTKHNKRIADLNGSYQLTM